MNFFRAPNFDFLRWRWQALGLSVLVVLAGVGFAATQGLPLGIDFKGGTIVVLKFSQPVTEETLRKAVDSIPGEKVVQQYGDAGQNELMVRLPEAKDVEQGFALEQGATQIVSLAKKAGLPSFEVISTEVVGPIIGADLQRKGIYATLASILGITIYIALRFRFSFAIGAIVATFHDIVVTFAFLAFFRYELSLNIIAAILTITGYSVNDTIVIFDRVRENLRTMRRDSLATVVNRSVNETLGRTIITAGTTFLAVLALYLFGGEVLEGFAFTMLVGIISGTYSTVFIASAIAIILSQKKGTAASATAATPVEARKGGESRSKKVGKARAS